MTKRIKHYCDICNKHIENDGMINGVITVFLAGYNCKPFLKYYDENGKNPDLCEKHMISQIERHLNITITRKGKDNGSDNGSD